MRRSQGFGRRFLDFMARGSHDPPSHRSRLSCGLRRLALEALEDRRLLSVGELLHAWPDPSTLSQNCQFGAAVATDGSLTVVGAYSASVQGYGGAGRAYVFNTSTGALVATLVNPTPATDDYFGLAVAISGNTVVVGATEGPGIDRCRGGIRL